MPSHSLDGVKSIIPHISNSDSSNDIHVSGLKAHIRMEENAPPIFCKARTVPYAEKNRSRRNSAIWKVKTTEKCTI